MKYQIHRQFKSFNICHIEIIQWNWNDILTQFILDCSSLNLPVAIRVPSNHPDFMNITRQCCSLTYAVHKDRTRQLRAMGLLQ